MQNILIPTDFSINAVRAADYAISLFGSSANYKIINCYEVPHSGATMLISIADILEKDSLQLLSEEKDRLLGKFGDLGLSIEVKSIMGSPSVAVRKIASPNDLIIMGTKGATGLKEVFVGSVASNMLENVPCPVIAIPEIAGNGKPAKILFAAD